MTEPISRPPTPAEAIRLRAALAAAGFIDAAVCERLGIGSVIAVEPLHAPFYLHQRLSGADPQAALIRLFLLQRSVPEAELRPAVGAAEVALLIELGMVEREGAVLNPLVDLYPYDGDWFATDRSDRAGEGEAGGRYDAVMPLNMSSHTLAQLVLPWAAESALDIGTGCGVHAIRLARRAGRVVATDLNPRALRSAAFNAALNGVANIEFRPGSLWEPVRGETFDQIVANPAFSLSARTEFMFRDGGARGDRMTRALLEDATRHLREAGVAQFIGEFPTVGESGFEEQVEGWVGEAPCDRLLLRFGAMEPLEYAAGYAHQPFSQTRAAYEAALRERLDAFTALGAREVALGAVLLRRRASGPHWTTRRVLPAPEHPLGHALGELIARLDDWETPDAPRRLWEGAPGMISGLRLCETRIRPENGWEVEETRASVAGDPLCHDVRLSEPARDLLTLCDGTRSGSEVAAAFAAAYELEAEEAGETTVAFLRELAELGLIAVEEGKAGTRSPGRECAAEPAARDPA